MLVEMRLSDETWYIIRNTPGVTGFVGTGTQPTPVSKKEIEKIKKRMGVEDPKFTVNYEIGEVVSVTDGPFKGFEGTLRWERWRTLAIQRWPMYASLRFAQCRRRSGLVHGKQLFDRAVRRLHRL